MQQIEKPSSDTPSEQKTPHELSSLEERIQRLENQSQKVDRLADAIETLAASNYELIKTMYDSMLEPEQEQGSGTLDG